ncbi:alpha/beta hydrolase [Achromobacter sp. HZ01]|jgi:pimeloyl-ACP methyl ester carboxylesterase|uniref:alpha/beta hydrolase n=1 Tax=Achromobacter sp. HZ01 TaxID=1416886 RepID=UPI000DC4CD06|nr:alpha/beta hydrolase [Achromobacter sp. HZ01]MBO9329855.1 alpha/beta fold hydrolase [Achromobacter xylosoxidans]RAP60648.1 alpha/beta hydrolase [Achromobacter sp. HZ01]
MNTAALSPLLSDTGADPLDFSLIDRLPAHEAGRGRLVIGARPGDARPGLLFVPGAYHGAWCYAHYLAYFAAAGLGCAALDLRGHGALAQDAAFASATIADLGQDVADALDALAGSWVVVGHSMGALPALLAARRRAVAGVVLLAPSPPGDLPGALALPPVPPAAPRPAPQAAEIRARFLATAPDRDVDAVIRRLCAESPEVLNDRYLLRVAIGDAPFGAPGLCLEAGLDTHDRHPPGQDLAIARRYGFSHAVLAGQPHCMMYADDWQTSARAILQWHRAQFG